MLKSCLVKQTGKNIYEYYRSVLNEKEKFVYDKIKESYTQFGTKLIINRADLETQDVSKAFQAVVLDHPEMFWIDSFSEVNIYDFRSITLNYNFSQEEALALQEKIQEKAHEIMEQTINMNNNYDKIKFIHDKLISISNYNKEYSLEQNNKYQSLVSIFDDGSTVCVGYAHAFKYFMDNLGIKSIIVKDISSDNFYDSHVWNMVELNYSWKHLDISWDKELSEKNIAYEFFLKNEDEFYINNKIQNHNIKNSIQGL